MMVRNQVVWNGKADGDILNAGSLRDDKCHADASRAL